jgi:hypothetical protein
VSAKPLIDYQFIGAERTLVLVPDLARGWRQHPKTWGFCEDVLFDGLEARVIRVQLKLLTKSKDPRATEPPQVADNRGHSEREFHLWDPVHGFQHVVLPRSLFRYRVERNRLELAIELLGEDDGFNPHLEWRQVGTGAPYVFFQQDGLKDTRPPSDDYGRIEFVLQVLVVARPSPLKKGPIEREWLKRFFPGGLPSLGKRS